LYCIDHDFSVTKKIDNLTIPNGLVWSIDNRTMYHIDSPTRKVRAYSFDSKTGEIVFERDAINIPSEMGSPDGMCIDEEGMLWIAQWNGFGVYRCWIKLKCPFHRFQVVLLAERILINSSLPRQGKISHRNYIPGIQIAAVFISLNPECVE
jgi:SMP-30/Gluconolactonase/LRE-like region